MFILSDNKDVLDCSLFWPRLSRRGTINDT
jgi:hypothetical protein